MRQRELMPDSCPEAEPRAGKQEEEPVLPVATLDPRSENQRPQGKIVENARPFSPLHERTEVGRRTAERPPVLIRKNALELVGVGDAIQKRGQRLGPSFFIRMDCLAAVKAQGP